MIIELTKPGKKKPIRRTKQELAQALHDAGQKHYDHVEWMIGHRDKAAIEEDVREYNTYGKLYGYMERNPVNAAIENIRTEIFNKYKISAYRNEIDIEPYQKRWQSFIASQTWGFIPESKLGEVRELFEELTKEVAQQCRKKRFVIVEEQRQGTGGVSRQIYDVTDGGKRYVFLYGIGSGDDIETIEQELHEKYYVESISHELTQGA